MSNRFSINQLVGQYIILKKWTETSAESVCEFSAKCCFEFENQLLFATSCGKTLQGRSSNYDYKFKQYKL